MICIVPMCTDVANVNGGMGVKNLLFLRDIIYGYPLKDVVSFLGNVVVQVVWYPA